MIQKRYERYTKDGIKWSKWFKVNAKDEDLKTLQKEDKWQLPSKLKNEYRIAPEEPKKKKK
jgi:hypothetical protein